MMMLNKTVNIVLWTIGCLFLIIGLIPNVLIFIGFYIGTTIIQLIKSMYRKEKKLKIKTS